VQSILQQRFADFELLIIDDASTDDTVAVIETIDDERIQLIRKPVNSGYTSSLNMGIDRAAGKYIARMDGDDLALPDRFEKQVAILERDPDIVVCGGAMQIIGSDELVIQPESHDAINVNMLSICSMCHPTVMMRTSFIRNSGFLYNPDKEPAEDYDLWVHLLRKGKFYNITEPVLQYRVHAGQTSQIRAKKRLQSALESKSYHLSQLCSEADARRYFDWDGLLERESIADELAHLKWLRPFGLQLLQQNARQPVFEPDLFRQFVVDYERGTIRKLFLYSQVYNWKKGMALLKCRKEYPRLFTQAEFFKTLLKCALMYRIKGPKYDQ
ncbi:MAG TPA: glycosyltransferase, partial [Ferruginibacter sp.]|nr:glycosyltransferase [Ferruginibacter sp.]